MAIKVGVLTSGGDAPGMNACVRAVVRTSLQYGFEVYGIHDGYKGILENNIEKMDRHSVSDILNRGGTILGTARLPEFKEEAVRVKAAGILNSYGINALVGIGGDGTYMGLRGLSHLGIDTIGLPGTIDNDIASTDYTIGFDTALNTIIECVDRLRDTSTSHQRCSVIEVMGNRCGDLAAYAGLATGAEITITNECMMTKQDVIEKLRQQRQEGKRHAMVIISEKITDVYEFAREIQEKSGFETRAEVIGHMQRGGSPTAFDRILASRMGVYAINLIKQGVTSSCVGIINNRLTYTDIDKALAMPRHTSEGFVKDAVLIA
jgi:6-phosphofructokinase 1